MASTGTRRQFCDTRMGQVHCVLAGSDSRTPLVLLHQTPRSVDEYAEVLPLLSAERRVIAVDTPGYGCSDPVAGQPAVDEYAAAILDALDVLDVVNLIPVGHHTGATLAVELAVAAPARVERVVLSGPMELDHAARESLRAQIQPWAIAPDGGHFVDKWQKVRKWVGPVLAQRIAADVFRAGTTSEQGRIAAIDYPLEQRLARASGPALLIFGARDPFSGASRVAMHRAAFSPVAESTVDGGPFLPNEAPEAFAAAILEWLRD